MLQLYLWVLWAVKSKENKTILRIYGFEGDAGQEGEGFTRIRESSYRRSALGQASGGPE